MISTRIRAIPTSNGRSFPSNILDFGKFKAYLNTCAHRLGIHKRFKPRLYTFSDYIFVKLYALVSHKSTYKACEDLNKKCTEAFLKKFHLQPKSFRDSIRKRRFIPNQSDVDKFFRLLTKKEVQNLFGNMNMQICEKIVTQIGRGQRWRVLIDNTEYPYYGKSDSGYEIGSNRHTGTRKMRLFQGHSLHGDDITLFYDLLLLKKGQYRSKDIPNSIKWLKWNRIPLSYALMDREFYRAALIKKLKMIHLPVIIPAKKFLSVQQYLKRYLLGQENLITIHHFRQTPKTKPWPSTVHVQLVIVGHKHQAPWVIRDLFRNNHLSFDEAYHKLSAFFTTTSPWKNKRAWSQWLTRTYKKRWNQETGFSKLNAIHNQYRYRFPVVQLAELHLRGFIYNGWQFNRHQQKRNGWKLRDLTLSNFQDLVKLQIGSQIMQNVLNSVNTGQKRKKEIYFDT